MNVLSSQSVNAWGLLQRQQLKLGQTFQQVWVVLHRSQTTLPVITVPRIYQQENSKKKKAEERATLAKRLEKIRQESRKGKKDVCIVRCKHTRLNHYFGQSYDKSKGIQLASDGWRHHKAKGDHFTICTQLGKGQTGSAPAESAVPPVSDGTVFAGVGAAPAVRPSAPRSFEELHVRPELVANLSQRGIVTPTEIQRRAIPRLMEGGGAVVAAETGCGKTLAFLVPLVERLLQEQEQEREPREVKRNQPRALVITPGRELATQIRDVAVQLTQGLPLTTCMLLGGRTKLKMLRPTLLDMDLLVSTFGALSKLTSTGVLDLSRVRQVVLDEADTLLDDSFREEVCGLLRRLPLRPQLISAKRQNAETSLTLVGATLPHNAASRLEGLVPGGALVEVTTRRLHRLLPHVEQTFLRLGPDDRPERLLKICRQAAADGHNVLVFSNQSRTSNWVSLYLNEHGVDCMNVNGAMHYKLRQGRWDAFVNGPPSVLSCTDVVSRGLDSVNVHLVVNYEFPWNTSDYLHRAGRVGREGSAPGGRVTSFVCRPLEIDMARRIEKSARTGEQLWNVDANIKHIIEKRMARKEAAASTRAHAQKQGHRR